MYRRLLSLLPMLALALSFFACSENPVGRKCFVGDPPDNDTQYIIASPALECESRECLHVPIATGKTPPEGSEYSDMCTDSCESSSDCDKVPESPCVSGFTCAVATTTGPFCCVKKCICKDYLQIPDGGIPDVAACEADNPDNLCINLPGR